jgi:hypothetical protein
MTETRLEPTSVGKDSGTRRGLLVGFAAVALLVVLLGFLSGELGPGPVLSFETIAGTNQRQGPGGQWYVQFLEDGIIHVSSHRAMVEDRPSQIWETRFESTKVFLNETKGPCDDSPDAIYEIHLLQNGNLQFIEIEDRCGGRSGLWKSAELKPVP